MKKYRNGFDFTLQPQDLELPLHWRKPRKIFVNSMSDLFHEQMPLDYLEKVFDVMRRADWHVYQILTKRPDRMLAYAQQYAIWHGEMPGHIWMGTSVESWAYKPRIDLLRKVPCAVRFLSLEPLLDTLMDGRPAYADQPEIRPGLDLTGIHWVIVGGESGQHLMKPEIAKERSLAIYIEGEPIRRVHWVPRGDRAEWVREIRDESQRQDVAFFFKQWGGVRPKSGGKLLDGQIWDQYPAGALERLNSRKQPNQVKVGCGVGLT